MSDGKREKREREEGPGERLREGREGEREERAGERETG